MVPHSASGYPSSVPGPYRIIVLLVLMAVAMLGPAGCGFSSDNDRDPLQNSSDSTAREEPLKTDISVEEARKLATPPSGEDGISVNAVSPVMGDAGDKTLQPARGLNTKRLFAESLRNEDERFERLESAVQSIRDDIDTLSPSIHRLEAVEGDIQELVSQLQVLVRSDSGSEQELSANQLNNDQGAINAALGADGTGADIAQETLLAPAPLAPSASSPPTPPAAPVTEPGPGAASGAAPPQTLAPPPQTLRPPDPSPPATIATSPPPGQLSLANIRMSDSAGKTRIVLESYGKLGYTADLDNNEHILTLVFERGDVAVNVAALASQSKLIKSVTSTPQANGGFVLAFTLNKSSSIIGQGAIAPNADNPRNRIFIDLAP